MDDRSVVGGTALRGLRAQGAAERARIAAGEPGGYTQLSVRARGASRARLEAWFVIPALPAPNRVVTTSFGDLLWLGPDEWLLVSPASQRERLLTDLLRVIGEDGAVVDVSAARVPITLTGPMARDVLASCCPLDLHSRAFRVGQCAQSLIGKAPVLLQQVDDTPTYQLLVRPSFADYVERWLFEGIVGLD